MRVPFIGLIAAGALALGGCAYGDYGSFGLGYGGGYGGYGGYYGSPYYGYGYGYSPYYGGFGSPYFGWYDDFYYPGTGIFVYDSYRRPHPWNDRQRNYWMSRQQAYSRTSNQTISSNWSGFPSRAHMRTVNGTPTATWHDSQRHR